MEKLDSSSFREKIYLVENRCAVLFTAPWCGFCNSMEYMMEKVQSDFSDMRFYRINIDEEKELADAFAVSAVPTLVVFEDGRVLCRATGLLKKGELFNLLGAETAVK